MYKKTKIQPFNVFFAEEIEELHITPKECHCEHQLCHGKFIPSRIGQVECLFSIREKQRKRRGNLA